jgi:hypothetical protein
MQYVRVVDGEVVTEPGELPKVWERISGFHLLCQRELAEYGWLPFIAGDPQEFDPRTHRAVWQVSITSEVRSYVTIEPLSETEVALNVESLKQELLARNAELRWRQEVGGIDFYGMDREVPVPVHTDRDSQITIFSAALRGQDELWKGRDGNWHPLSAQDLALLSESIAQHKRICFKTEAQFASMIKGCDSFADLDEIDLEALWNGSVSE